MKITAHTPLGVFVGKDFDASNEETETVYKTIRAAARGDALHFQFDTDSSIVFIPGEMLKETVFILE